MYPQIFNKFDGMLKRGGMLDLKEKPFKARKQIY